MQDPREPEKDPAAGPEDESRRSFIKKLPYIAPVVQTFLLSETAFGSDQGNNNDNQGDNNDNQGNNNDNNNNNDDDHGRRRREVSPHTRGRARGRG